jgi:CubicO group peptidase (beta-lactamase class C family)
VATDVCGWLIEQISGQKFEDFLHDRLFAPLGMVDTGFHVREGQGHRLASCYQATPTGGLKLQDDCKTSDFLTAPSFVSGGGGLVSTAGDFMKFAQMVLNGGTANGHRYLGRKTLDLMAANHLPGNSSIAAMSKSLFSEAAYDGIGFGLGFSTTMRASQTLMPGSDGDLSWGGLASTYFWIDPEEDLIGILMTQVMPSSAYPIRRELRTMVYAALDD